MRHKKEKNFQITVLSRFHSVATFLHFEDFRSKTPMTQPKRIKIVHSLPRPIQNAKQTNKACVSKHLPQSLVSSRLLVVFSRRVEGVPGSLQRPVCEARRGGGGAALLPDDAAHLLRHRHGHRVPDPPLPLPRYVGTASDVTSRQVDAASLRHATSVQPVYRMEVRDATRKRLAGNWRRRGKKCNCLSVAKISV